MGLRDRLRRLQKAARGEMDWLDLQDGSRFYFEPLEARKELFMEMMDVLHTEFAHIPDLSDGPSDPEEAPEPASADVSELRAALSKATPASLARFEERYGVEYEELGVVHDHGRVEYARPRAVPEPPGEEDAHP